MLPLSLGHGLLHQAAPLPDHPDRVRQPERARCHQGAVFAEAVSGDPRGPGRTMSLQHPERGDRYRQDRRLGVFRPVQVGFGAAKAELAEVQAQRVLRFLEDRPGLREPLA